MLRALLNSLNSLNRNYRSWNRQLVEVSVQSVSKVIVSIRKLEIFEKECTTKDSIFIESRKKVEKKRLHQKCSPSGKWGQARAAFASRTPSTRGEKSRDAL